MNFSQAIASGFRNYFSFLGRASRSEYWFWMLFVFLGSNAAKILDEAIFYTKILNENIFSRSALYPVCIIFVLVILIPSWTIGIRRLHDVSRSGWWVLISLTIIGLIYPLLVWGCTKGTNGNNRFGNDPLIDNPPGAVKSKKEKIIIAVTSILALVAFLIIATIVVFFYLYYIFLALK